jgi:hypothetical protein
VQAIGRVGVSSVVAHTLSGDGQGAFGLRAGGSLTCRVHPMLVHVSTSRKAGEHQTLIVIPGEVDVLVVITR